jgi:hypothetical protein
VIKAIRETKVNVVMMVIKGNGVKKEIKVIPATKENKVIRVIKETVEKRAKKVILVVKDQLVLRVIKEIKDKLVQWVLLDLLEMNAFFYLRLLRQLPKMISSDWVIHPPIPFAIVW